MVSPTLTQTVVAAILRHALTWFGGMLVAHGLLSGSEETTAVAAVMTLVGLAWSVMQKRSHQETLDYQDVTISGLRDALQNRGKIVP